MTVTNLQQFKAKLSQNPDFDAAYQALKPEYELLKALLSMRERAGLTQADVAQRLGTQRTNISRLESGRTSPNLKTLQKYADACGFDLTLEFHPKP